jgi:uncharacterized protein YybS (DUF2232 family)
MNTTAGERDGGSRLSAGLRGCSRPEPRAGSFLAAACAAAALVALAVLAPVLGLLAALAPLPLIVHRIRAGPWSAVSATLVATALLSALSPGRALFFLMFLALPGLLIGEATARGRGIVKGAVWAFLLLALQIGVVLVFAGPRMATVATAPFEETRSAEFLELLRGSGWTPEHIEAWTEQSRTMGRAMAVVYPAVFVILGGLVVLANAALLRAYLLRRDPGWLESGEFEGVRWTFALVPAFVLSGAAVLLPALRHAGYNVLLLVGFLFALQGLAVVTFYARRLAGPPLLRFALMFLVLLNPWAPQILALLGLFDAWFDFRRWAEPPEPQRGQG